MTRLYDGSGKTVDKAVKEMEKYARKNGDEIDKGTLSYLIGVKEGRALVSGTWEKKYEDALFSTLEAAGITMRELLENIKKYSITVHVAGRGIAEKSPESKEEKPAVKGKPSPAAEYKKGPKTLTDLF